MAGGAGTAIVLGGLALLAFAFSSKSSAAQSPNLPPPLPATPLPPVPHPSEPKIGPKTAVTASGSGRSWLVQLVSNEGGTSILDVYAPAGAFGATQQEFRVLRYSQQGSDKTTRRLVNTTSDTSDMMKAIVQLAIQDFGINVGDNTEREMPLELQQAMANALALLTVSADGKIVGPVTPQAVQNATETAGRIEKAGFPSAAATLRAYAQEAAKKIPPPPPAEQVVVPGVPADLLEKLNRALQLERDPAKLRALRDALLALPASAQRDAAVQMLEALIIQTTAQQSTDNILEQIDQVIKSPGQPTGSPPRAETPLPAPPPNPNPMPATPHGTGLVNTFLPGSRMLVLPKDLVKGPFMTGTDVRVAQERLVAHGFNPGKLDGVYGKNSGAAAGAFQKAKKLTVDKKIGPKTWTALALPPSVPAAAASLPPESPAIIPSSPVPQSLPRERTAQEIAAEQLVNHLLQLQAKAGGNVKSTKGKQDMTLVKRFQAAEGLKQDGLPGPNTMVLAAGRGQGNLPLVMYWPKTADAAYVQKYRASLNTIANDRAAKGFPEFAAALRASALRERGQSGIVGPLLT